MQMDSAAPIRALVIVTTRYGTNGITNVVKNYAAHTDCNRVVFDYVCINEPTAQERQAIEAKGGRLFVYRRNRRPLGYFTQLVHWMKHGDYDLVHAHGNSATLLVEMAAAKRAGIPVRISHSHNTKTSFPLLHRLLQKSFLNTLTHRLACGTAAGKWLYLNEPFTVLPNAIDTERFRFTQSLRDEARRLLHMEANRIYVHVGSLIPAKNHAYLLDAFQIIHAKEPGARLLLVGGGRLREELKKRAYFNRIQDAVLFLGARSDVPAIYAAADAFLLPSLHEGLPLTLLEAQSMGLPCLVSEAVTQEAYLTPLVQGAVLADGLDRFAEAAMALPKQDEITRHEAYRAIRLAGYDIHARAEELYDFYCTCLTEVGQR